jgi:hypothetical protein
MRVKITKELKKSCFKRGLKMLKTGGWISRNNIYVMVQNSSLFRGEDV